MAETCIDGLPERPAGEVKFTVTLQVSEDEEVTVTLEQLNDTTNSKTKDMVVTFSI